MSNPLRIGVVGLGWAGQQAVLAANAGPRTEVVAVADLSGELRSRVMEEYSIPSGYETYSELLADEAVDAVYLAVNPVMRRPMVFDSFKAGKHTLVQKPHAVRADEILEFEAAAKEAGKTLQFCYFMRHHPHNRSRRAAIQAGKIGEPYHARIFLKFNFLPEPEGITRWLQVYGQKGGALGQHASHEFDLAWWLMGCPKPLWAFAAMHSVYPKYDGPEGPAEDYFSGMVGLEGNKTIQIDCSRWLHTDSPTTFEVYGSEGALTGGKISRYKDGAFVTEDVTEPSEIEHTQPPDPGPCFYYEIEHFAMAVAGDVEPDVNVADSFTFMKILDAIYDSAKIGEKIEIA
ncbi:MAG: Gfo/Idh/MocA family oxidoreductase [Planctomycetota bacterium]|nr:Gfo/Idh/MocA family oxidoreductase [Planctomycetota bacterium]MDA1141384.1 Gfo/Idh/MocA family oxidoreductase [Planctomycetota bacterium]